jgi:ABC-type multidrug transport system ATPase subunit
VSAPPLSAVDFDDISVDEVSRTFGRRRALTRVTFKATRGTVLGLLGPNGAGKSTMLAILATLMRPSSGKVRFGGIDPLTAGAPLRSRIGVLGHDLFLYPELTARENLTFFAGLYDLPDPAGAALDGLRRAGLDDRADDPVGSFSRGMRQRVALERALIHGPRVVLLDEPFTGLDDASARSLVARLNELRAAGCILIVATHDLDLAEGLLDQVVFLRDGRVVQSVNRPDGLRNAYRDAMARRES